MWSVRLTRNSHARRIPTDAAAAEKRKQLAMTSTLDLPFQRLGVNIDHVATIRNARGGRHPDPLRAAHLAAEAGADGITAHLREDRRHISDHDIARLKAELTRPLNLEMAATEEMLAIALRHVPNACCLVPERREERTTEGGLDVAGGIEHLRSFADRLKEAGIRVSLFIEPDPRQIEAAVKVGADIVELHTGSYCERALDDDARGVAGEMDRLRTAARIAAEVGLEVHAGHGLTYNTVAPVARIPQVVELNIGHFLIGEAIFGGLHSAVRRMRALMDEARASVTGRRSALAL
jgi:pyridoxine 5-phosphate synthase